MNYISKSTVVISEIRAPNSNRDGQGEGKDEENSGSLPAPLRRPGGSFRVGDHSGAPSGDCWPVAQGLIQRSRSLVFFVFLFFVI